MKHQTMITLNDTTLSAITKLSKGNPGAAVAMAEIMKSCNESFGIHYILLLDAFGIYGTDIYVLYSDICGRDVSKTKKVLDDVQDGKISQWQLRDACGRQDYSGREIIFPTI